MATITARRARLRARGSSRRSSPGVAGDLLELQRTAGNAAVTALLTSVQRFEGPEHRDLGDTTVAEIDLGSGVVLSWGEIVALAGDEYPSLDKLVEDTRTEAGRQRLRAALEHDEIPGPHSSALPAGADATAQEALRAERELAFTLLALQNIEHFVEGGSVESWQGAHAAALHQAGMAAAHGDAGAWEMAKAREAFGQHFLTDSFSGGHIRTPRREITEWYVGTFAPRVGPHFLDAVRNRIVDGVTAQVGAQTSWPDFVVRREVAPVVDRVLAEQLARIGGRPGFIRWLGLAIAGAVSGALHDLEGARGVVVTSEAHPDQWRAYGDGSLEHPPAGGEADVAVSRAQAEQAVLTAHADLETAYLIGHELYETEGAGSRPERVHFGFNADALDADATAAAARGARYLDRSPEMRAELVGHTDPIGGDVFNDELGARRARAVERALLAAGVAPERLVPTSEGRRRLLTTDRRRYRLNRRVEFVWEPQPGPWRDLVGEDVQERLAARLPAPYENVLRFIPHPVPADNVELENWRWGEMPPAFVGSVRDWILRRVNADQVMRLLQTDDLDEQVVEGYTVRPRPVIEGIIADLLADPMGFLERHFGEAPGR